MIVASCILRLGLVYCFLTLCVFLDSWIFVLGSWSMVLVSHFLCLDYCFVFFFVQCVLLHVYGFEFLVLGVLFVVLCVVRWLLVVVCCAVLLVVRCLMLVCVVCRLLVVL